MLCGGGDSPGSRGAYTHKFAQAHKKRSTLTKVLTSGCVSGDTPILTSTRGIKDTLVSLHTQTHVLRPHVRMGTHTLPLQGISRHLHVHTPRWAVADAEACLPMREHEHTPTSTHARRHARHMFPRGCGKWCSHARACTLSYTRSVGGYTHMVTRMKAVTKDIYTLSHVN